MMHKATARVAHAHSPRPNECMFCEANDRRPLDILQMNSGQSRAARRNDPAMIKVGSFREGFMLLLSEVARVQSVCVHAVNASLSTDRFAAAH